MRTEANAPQEVSAPYSASAAVETSGRTAADAIRSSEPVHPAPQTPARGSSAQAFVVRIAQPNAPTVDLHVAERNGQVQVAVRTPDTGLQTSLRQDLGTLVHALERAGYHTETFAPRAAQIQTLSQASSQALSQLSLPASLSPAANHENANHESANHESNRPGDHGSPHQSFSGRGSGESSGESSGDSGRGRQQQQHQGGQDSQDWTEEWKNQA